MRWDQFEHVIRAAGTVLGEDTVIVIGSQALLANLDRAVWEGRERDLTKSIEVDVLPLDDFDGAKADTIDGDLGELSGFHEMHGIYGDGVGERTAVLPDGWRDRLIRYENLNTNGVSALCLEVHDLAVSKLAAGREKDLEFVRNLIKHRIIDPRDLRPRLAVTETSESVRARISGFIRRETPEAGHEPPEL